MATQTQSADKAANIDSGKVHAMNHVQKPSSLKIALGTAILMGLSGTTMAGAQSRWALGLF